MAVMLLLRPKVTKSPGRCDSPRPPNAAQVWNATSAINHGNLKRPWKVIVAYCDGLKPLLSARCFPFLRLPSSATGSGRLRHPFTTFIRSTNFYVIFVKIFQPATPLKYFYSPQTPLFIFGDPPNPGNFAKAALPSLRNWGAVRWAAFSRKEGMIL